MYGIVSGLTKVRLLSISFEMKALSVFMYNFSTKLLY